MKKLPDDYFLEADDELVKFLEIQGEECIREINQSTSINKENGYKLLSILIVGIGASFLLLTQKTNLDFMGAGIAVFTIFWTACAAYLVLRVLSTKQRVLTSASPYDLYHEGYKGFTKSDYDKFCAKGYSGKRETLSILRRYRLESLTHIADLHEGENRRISRDLDRVRIATILTPVCAIVIAAFTYFFL